MEIAFLPEKLFNLFQLHITNEYFGSDLCFHFRRRSFLTVRTKHITIRDWCTVQAGAVVRKNISVDTIVVGNLAKVIATKEAGPVAQGTCEHFW